MLGKLTTATFILTSIAVMFFNYREQQSVVVTAGIARRSSTNARGI